MPVEKWSDNVAVVRLADDPQLGEDLDALDQLIGQHQNRLAAVIDFSGVRFVNSSNLAKLLKLRRQTNGGGGRLVLCGIDTHVWGAFLVTNLDKVFDFSDSVTTALATLQIDPAGREST